MEIATDDNRAAEKTAVISINKKELMAVMEPCKRIAVQRNYTPILSNVLFVAKDSSTICAIATDTDTSVRGIVGCSIDGVGVDVGDVSFAVPGGRFYDCLKSMPDGLLVIRLDGNAVVLSSDKTPVQHNVTRVEAQEFPALPEPDGRLEGFTMPASSLAWLIKRTAYAIGDESRGYKLDCAKLVGCGGTLRMYGADRHRFVNAAVRVESLRGSMSMLIPESSVLTLSTLVKGGAGKRKTRDPLVVVERTYSHVFFTIDNIRLTARLMDGKYLEVEKGLKEFRVSHVVRVKDRKDFLGVLRSMRVTMAAKADTWDKRKKPTYWVDMEPCGSHLKVSTVSSEGAESSATVEADCEEVVDADAVDRNDVPTIVRVNTDYMLEAMKSFDDVKSLVMRLGDVQPIQIECENEIEGRSCLTLVMPIGRD